MDAERSGTISSVVANEVLHKLDKALGESEYKQEEIQESARTEDNMDSIVEEELTETLIPESTESIVGTPVKVSEEE